MAQLKALGPFLGRQVSRKRRKFSKRVFARLYSASAPAADNPMAAYSQMIESGAISSDPRQLHLMTKLNDLHFSLQTYAPKQEEEDPPEKTPSPLASFLNIFKNQQKEDPVEKIPDLKGLYIYGSPGCGKTFLMDVFYSTIDRKRKSRVHFNKFMLDLHAKMHEFKKSKKEIAGNEFIMSLAKSIAEKSDVICFDEFQVTDIADAVLVNQVFTALFKLGVIVVATSNREPDELYKNGLQRHQVFEPFLPVLKRHTDVINMDSNTDYRQMGTGITKPYLYPLNSKNRATFEAAFLAVCEGHPSKATTIPVMAGRSLTLPHATETGVCKASFEALCKDARGAADYNALAEHFHTVFITEVPQMTILQRNELKRFILLVDELYQAHVQVRILADVAVGQLFVTEVDAGVFDEVFAWERTLSRLIEMQSEEYLEKQRQINT